MSHPFGDLLSQYLHRKHGLSQARLAAGINQPPFVISLMCRGERLTGRRARARVLAIINWLQEQGVFTDVDEKQALLTAAGLPAFDPALPDDIHLLHILEPADPALARLPHASLPTETSFEPCRDTTVRSETSVTGQREQRTHVCQHAIGSRDT